MKHQLREGWKESYWQESILFHNLEQTQGNQQVHSSPQLGQACTAGQGASEEGDGVGKMV